MFTCSSIACQRKHWPEHRSQCLGSCRGNTGSTTENTRTISYYCKDGREVSESIAVNGHEADVSVTLKCCGNRKCVKLSKNWDGAVIFKIISNETSVPFDSMKVIIKGKMVTSDNITDYICDKTLVMVLGSAMESAEGLEVKDIECLMSQLGVSRNIAISALRKCGSLLDAMVEVGK